MDLTGVTVDLAPVYTATVTIVTALAGMIAVRKIIKLFNRS